MGREMRLALYFATIGAVASCTAALAQPAQNSLPFGLEYLHWNMTSAEALQQASPLAPQTPPPADSSITNQFTIFFGPYHWRDCVFNMSLYFSHDQFDSIDLEAKAVSPACRSAMQDDLGAHPVNAKVTFNSFGTVVEVSISERNGPPLLIYDTVQSIAKKPPTSN